MLTSASRRCSGLTLPSGPGMPWSNIIMSCWIMPSHFGSGYFPDPGGFSLPCRSCRCAMYARAACDPVSSLFLVLPQNESARSRGCDVETAEAPRDFHHERSSRSVVVRRLAPAMAVHMAADDVHLFGMRRADLREIGRA